MFIAIDIGGTKTTVASFAALHPDQLIQSDTFVTPQKYQDFLNQISQKIKDHQANYPIDGIGISFASRLNQTGQIVLKSNLPDYYHHIPTLDLQSQFDFPVKIHNDAVCAARAQMRFGQTQTIERLLHLILSTGFGGAFIARFQDQLFELPLEPEYTFIHPNGLNHTQYPYKGLTGAYIAGGQLEAQINQPLVKLPDNHPIWQQLTEYLTYATINLYQLFQPEIITFSGKLIQKRAFILEQVAHKLNDFDQIISYPPPLELSLLKNPSLIGALSLLENIPAPTEK